MLDSDVVLDARFVCETVRPMETDRGWGCCRKLKPVVTEHGWLVAFQGYNLAIYFASQRTLLPKGGSSPPHRLYVIQTGCFGGGWGRISGFDRPTPRLV
jgi:hypothetical protein